MAKNPNSGEPAKGSMTPLQTTIKANGSMIDTRLAPCGDNTLTNPDQDGDETPGRYGY